MTGSAVKNSILSSAIVAGGLISIFFLSGFIEAKRPELAPDFADSDLSFSGSRLKGFTFGMDGLLADWYYMRALQYVGDKLINSKTEVINIDDLSGLNPRLLYPFLDNATELDPHFIDAYLYGAIVLPAIDADKAIAITQKGIAHNPGEWRLYRPLGYIYWKLGRYDEAAEIYEKGSELPGAPAFMRLMAASMKTKGGSRETAREIYREMYSSAEDEPVKITAQRRLAQLDSLDEQDTINTALDDFKKANGRCAERFSELLPKLALIEMPGGHKLRWDKAHNILDPTDAPYLLDKENCRARLDVSRSGISAQ